MFTFPSEEANNNSNVANMPTNRGQNESWKSDAFINIWLPKDDGRKGKLGSIPLKLSRAGDKQIIEYLREDPSRIYQLLKTAEVDFKMADGSDSAGFALPGAE